MQLSENNEYLSSPSDLVTFLECKHASFLDVKQLTEPVESAEKSATAKLLQEKGSEHESFYLETLKADGKDVTEIPKNISLKERSELTLKAMKSGVDVIYQAVLSNKSWRGDADFLIKCNIPSKLGSYSYEVLDTKLARSSEPKHIMQLCVYSELLTDLQGFLPEHMYLFLGDKQRYSFKVSDFLFYYERTKKRFEDYIQNIPQSSCPEPCSHCDSCSWKKKCSLRWKEDDHLSLVANIQRSQIDKLRSCGINTVANLASTSPQTKVPDLNQDVFLRLRSQAMLQTHKATTGENKCEIIPSPPEKGFMRMPEPNEGDLFFDMEGDPLYPNGLEYLFGIYYSSDGEEVFKPFWAHDHEEEKETFITFMAFLDDHLSKHANAYIYHYNHYETTALKRLACRYAVCEEQLDNLLRQNKFIDLYLVVRESIRISETGYSIKNLETFYMEKRSDAVSTAMDSIISYNEWRQTHEDKLLQDIASYNEVDCESTYLLRNWLLTLKPKNSPWFRESPDEITDSSKRKDWEIEYEKYKQLLGVNDKNPSKEKELLSYLLEFHNREDKPKHWSRFDRQNKYEDELVEDTECLGGLIQLGIPEQEKNSLIYTYTFPPQEYKLKIGNNVDDTATMKTAGTIVDLNEDTSTIKLKRGKNNEPLPKQFSIGPSRPIDNKIIRSALYRYADEVIENTNDSHAATELLARAMPRVQGIRTGDSLITSIDLKSGILDVITNLDDSYLFIQGAPGTGKTYTCSHIIVDLIKQGKKIGITSNSHKAIHNLLKRVEDVAKKKGILVRGIKKYSTSNKDSFYKGTVIESVAETNNFPVDTTLFAGTVWLFSDQYFVNNQLDYLFIDEAGQVGLANVIAMAASTKNIILIGDQMQLGQPIQGIHPGEAGLSVLEFLLGERSTVQKERGIFLNETYRLRPNICSFISEAFYDGRLTPNENTSKRSLDLKHMDLPNEGISLIEVNHEGCSQKSMEEGRIIKETYQKLLRQTFHDKDGETRGITEDDILVVTPFNVQVNYLQSLLPEHAKIGTVDKFQGQEAPIVLISMVTSSAEDLPRNIEFLYSKNRLNVAISRAQCLAVIIANPKLFEIPCKTVEQMKLVNTFCRLDKYAVKKIYK